MPTRPPLPPLAIRAWLRYDVVRRVLDRLHPSTVLEIGCGQGAFGARVARRAEYLGVEPDPVSYAVAKARVPVQGGEVRNLSATELGDHLADLVCAFEVLEHLQDDEAALREWVSHVRPGGHLLISVPADPARFGPMDLHAGHFRRYDGDQLAALLTQAGLTDVEVTTYGWPLGFALEAVRNRVDTTAPSAPDGATMAERTAASGRLFQPSRTMTGWVIAGATTPFRLLQRLRPHDGVGLVAVGRRLG